VIYQLLSQTSIMKEYEMHSAQAEDCTIACEIELACKIYTVQAVA